MTRPTACHQLGRFIVAFQGIEALLNELLALIANSDHEAVLILANDLEYGKRLRTADVLFARFTGLMRKGDDNVRREFHSVMAELAKLGERRNDLVHSTYNDWFDMDGNQGLLRRHSRLRGKAGEREETTEELQPEAFDADLEALASAHTRLDALRLQAIDWLHPIET